LTALSLILLVLPLGKSFVLMAQSLFLIPAMLAQQEQLVQQDLLARQDQAVKMDM
jgi:hypothetical protein